MTLMTDFKVSSTPLAEHPRPQFKRDNFVVLNGEWDYVILNKLQEELEDFNYEGKIVVPFCVESALSKVEKKFTENDTLVYRRYIDKCFNSGCTILHFDAVDYKCFVYLNGKKITENIGGYFNFSVDITNELLDTKNELVVIVQDPSDTQRQQRGKQSLKNGGIWYTATSGIWQTVWLENVPNDYITSIKMLPNVDNKTINFKVSTLSDNVKGTIEIYYKEKLILKHNGAFKDIELGVAEMHLWTPETPELYDVVIRYKDDVVKTYFAMRKFELKGTKFFLNNKPYFLTGLLDQGYFPDGLLTAPNDEALKYDIILAKDLGFNTLRKHIKIEPHRWYYYCDKLGMIVWQDMINGGGKFKLLYHAILPTMKININDKRYKVFGREDPNNRAEYVNDLSRMVNQLYNYPSICLWGIFNEAWGQFDSTNMLKYLQKLDTSRAIDATSGWYNQGNDLISIHKYILPFKMPKTKKAVALTEFGGYSVAVKDHVYNEDKTFGYLVYKDLGAFNKAVEELYSKQIIPSVKKGLAACIFTQLTDVEEEINGLITYDRKIVKVYRQLMKEINRLLKLQ